MSLTKRLMATLLAATVAITAVAGCGSDKVSKEAAAEKPVIKILNNTESLCLAPVHIAIINGYFDEEFGKIGQKYEIVQSNMDTVTEQLASGHITAGYGLTGSLMKPIASGLPLAYVTGLHRGCTKLQVTADSGINRLEDLRGKTIGVATMSDSAVIQIKRKLHRLGLKVSGADSEISFATYAPTDLPQALASGSVDAIGAHDPVAYKAEQSYGFKKLFDIGADEGFRDEYCCQAYVAQSIIKDNPEGAAAYARAIQRAAAFVAANPEEAARLQVKHGYMPAESERDIVEYGHILAGLNYQPSVALGRQTFVDTFRELQAIGDLDATLDIDEFTRRVYPDLPGVPEGYRYDTATGEFTELSKEG